MFSKLTLSIYHHFILTPEQSQWRLHEGQSFSLNVAPLVGVVVVGVGEGRPYHHHHHQEQARAHHGDFSREERY